MTKPNWKNRTLWTGDNLDVMRGMNSESVDLIYLDPPFNSNKKYAAPIGSKAAGAAFKDTWKLSDLDEAWHGEVAEQEPAVYAIIDAAGASHGKRMKSYLIMMAVRLLEIRRLLKPSGSVYLHCDPTASHYLKMLLDAALGQKNFRSEIVWRRSNAHSKTTTQFGPIHDILLYYSRSENMTFHPGTRPYTTAYIEGRFKKRDEGGRFQLNYLTGSETRDGESGEPWRGFDPTAVGRHWAIPSALRPFLPSDGNGMSSHEQLEHLYQQGLIVFPKKEGGQPMYKQYIGSGVPYQDVWAYQPNTRGVLYQSDEHIDQDVKWLENEPEKTDYPTQKPLGLLDRIIQTSSDKGDVVLDPFCGCATACVSAERLGRQWVGIDLSPMAATLVKSRIKDEMGGLFYDINHRTDIPSRTDLGKLPSYKTHKHTLFGKQEGLCKGCRISFPFQNFTIDHKVPRIKGGTDHISNLQLLCNACNSLKGDRSHAYLVSQLKKLGRRETAKGVTP